MQRRPRRLDPNPVYVEIRFSGLPSEAEVVPLVFHQRDVSEIKFHASDIGAHEVVRLDFQQDAVVISCSGVAEPG